MNRISNGKIEKYYFEMFRKDYPLPSGEVSYRDSPDIIIDGEKRTGIEMTNFYLKKGSSSESEQVQSDLREKALSKAQCIYEKKTEKKIVITFGFDKANPIQDWKELAEKLAHLARSIDNFKTGQLERDIFKTIAELSFVYLNNKEYDNARWKVSQVHNIPLMSRDQLVEIVRDRERLSKKYEGCDA